MKPHRIDIAQRREERLAWLLIAPAFLTVAGVLVYPLLYSLWISLERIDLIKGTTRFAGLGNYASVLRDPVFWLSVANTGRLAVIVIVGTVVLGLSGALLLNQQFFGRGFARAILMLPWSLSQVVLAMLFGWILNGTYGSLNGLLKGLGLIHEYKSWFASSGSAMLLLGLILVWSAIPLAALFYLAALQTIPEEHFEAAMVDGAGPLARLWHITLPWLRPTSMVVLVISTLEGFMAFSVVYLMTGGGPGRSTLVLSLLGYQTTFESFDLGRGSALFWLLGAWLFLLSLVYARLFRQELGGNTAK